MIIKSAFNCQAHTFLTRLDHSQEVRIVSQGLQKNLTLFVHKAQMHSLHKQMYSISTVLKFHGWGNQEKMSKKHVKGTTMKTMHCETMAEGCKVTSVLIFTSPFDRTTKVTQHIHYRPGRDPGVVFSQLHSSNCGDLDWGSCKREKASLIPFVSRLV